MSRVYVIGAGLGGLSAALMASEAGHDVTVVSRGIGGLGLSTGLIDVLGYREDSSPVDDPYAAIDEMVHANPCHPYASIGSAAVRSGVTWLCQATPELGWNTRTGNSWLPTAVGSVRATLGVPASMADAILTDGARVRVVSISGYKDFPARLIADNLSRSDVVSVDADAATIKLAARDETDSTATTYARALDAGLGATSSSTVDTRPGNRAEAPTTSELAAKLVEALRPLARDGRTLLLPAVLGLDPATFAWVRTQLGTPLAEVVFAPPSVPGRRINDALTSICRDKRIDIQLNAVAVGGDIVNGHLNSLRVQRAGRHTTHRVDAVIHAGGGFESGTLTRDSHGRITEAVFGLPVFTPAGRRADQLGDDLDGSYEMLRSSTDILSCGVRVDSAMRPMDADARVIADNLHCVGSIIGGALPWREHSGEGITLGSAWQAVDALTSRGTERTTND